MRYAIHDALKSVMAKAASWKQVETMLARRGIAIYYKYRSSTKEVQGISFEKDGVKFKGSAIDRKFSFANMEKQLNENLAMEATQSVTDSRPLAEQIREILQQPQEQRSQAYEPQGLGLLEVLLDTYTPPEPESMSDAERRRRKRKKQEAQSRGISR